MTSCDQLDPRWSTRPLWTGWSEAIKNRARIIPDHAISLNDSWMSMKGSILWIGLEWNSMTKENTMPRRSRPTIHMLNLALLPVWARMTFTVMAYRILYPQHTIHVYKWSSLNIYISTYPPTPRLKLEGEASRKDRWQSLNLRPKTKPKTASSHPLGLNPAGDSLFRMHAAQSPLRTDWGTFSHAFALLLAVSKMPLRHPVCGRITYPLGLNPAGVSLFRMHAAQSPLRTDCGTFWHALLCF